MNIEILNQFAIEQVCDVCRATGRHCYSCNSRGTVPTAFGSAVLDFIEKYMEVSVSASSDKDVETTAWASLRRK